MTTERMPTIQSTYTYIICIVHSCNSVRVLHFSAFIATSTVSLATGYHELIYDVHILHAEFICMPYCNHSNITVTIKLFFRQFIKKNIQLRVMSGALDQCSMRYGV